MTGRSGRVVVLAHCHLNVMTKVLGLASYQGARTEIVMPAIDSGAGIVQLPCPEASFGGMRRWGMTREQYDTRPYRRHCRRILEPVVDTLSELASSGYAIERVVGVDGSPSCGVGSTCTGYHGGELPESCPLAPAIESDGPGVFMEELKALLDETGLEVRFEGAAERG